METPKIFESEYRFMQVLWENEPINSTKLVGLCKEQLGWSKATTYTVIRRLAERGVLVNEETIVRSLISQDEVHASEIEELVEKSFDDSLPRFLAAFTRRRKLKKEEVELLQKMIDEFEE